MVSKRCHFIINNYCWSQLIVGVLRTVTCGGWVYITSTDDHDTHDVFMIAYIILTIPWNIITIKKGGEKWKKGKILCSISFFGTLIPLIYWFIQHKVKIRPGAYSIYAYFEWTLIILDILFDFLCLNDFQCLDILFRIKPTFGLSFMNVGKQDVNDQEDDPDYILSEQEDISFLSDDEVLSIDKEEITQLLIEKDIIIPQENKKSHFNTMRDSANFEIFINIIDFIIATYQSFLFWTSATALLCIIWHFPLWYMGISGYELSIFFLVAPVLYYIPYCSLWVNHYGTLLSSLIALGSYLVSIPEKRLIVVGIGCSLCVLNFVYYIYSMLDTDWKILEYSVCWCLGLTLSVIVKMGWFTNNPLWPIMYEGNGGWNKTGIIIGLVLSFIAPNLNKFKTPNGTISRSTVSYTLVSKSLIIFGFGSLLFAIHQLLSDSSTLIYWSWEGWNMKNGGTPLLHWPWSSLTCLIMLFSSLTNFILAPTLSKKCVVILLLTISTLVLSSSHITEWDNYLYGGVPYLISIIWCIPYYFQSLYELHSISVFCCSFFIYVLLILAHVWTVAYAFVPYGWLLRERLPHVLLFSTLNIILGLIVGGKPAGYSIRCHSVKCSKFYRFLVGMAVTLFTLLGIFHKQLQPFKTGLPQPHHAPEKLFTAGIWTIHFGLDNDMWASEKRIINLIESMELDVVGLLETDTQRITMGNRDLTNELGHKLNMYADYGPGPNKHTWGCALLSKFPIIESKHYLLPSPKGELAPAIHATLQMYGGKLVDVFVFHSGQEEDEEDRRLQSEKLAQYMGSVPIGRPSILLSYLVTKPHEGFYNNYVSDVSGMHDIEPEDMERWCEYILYKNLKRVGYARVSRGTITDTELQVGKFQVLDDNEIQEVGEDLLYQNHKVKNVDEVPWGLRFPSKYLGEGVDGHCYHVFGDPYYYDFDLDDQIFDEEEKND
ncbi:related to Protein CWH43 [Saccharomycodes ludwigii]|uniref:Related to Protein CWH43 n=1 Tax=Saccharomycodes ludwigii TaxID=36035 RepID=A0A376B8P1_9ASCO|nr:related to Protein CWH43 [Saccharomycodes ludwigii]